VQTERQLLSALPEIEARIGKVITKTKKKATRQSIEKIIKRAKIRKQGGKPVGNLTPEIQAIFDDLLETIKLPVEQAKKRLQANLDSVGDTIPDQTLALENEILSMKVNMEDMTQAELDKTSETLTALFEDGRMINELERFNRMTETQQLRDLTVDRITKGEGVTPGLETTGIQEKGKLATLKQNLKSLGQTFILSWDSMMETLEWETPVGKEVLPETFDVQPQENSFKDLSANAVNTITGNVSKAYNIPQVKIGAINNKIGELQKQVSLGKFKNRKGILVDVKMSKDKMIERYMQFKDTTLTESFELGNNYTPEIKNAIVNGLSRQDKQLGDLILESYQDQYKVVNPVYRNIYGVNLPSNDNYSPIKRSGFKLNPDSVFGQLNEDNNYRRAIAPGAIKSRVENTRTIDSRGALSTLSRHLDETNYFVSWSERIRQLNSVFIDNEVRTVIKEKFGSKLLGSIDKNLQQFTQNGNSYAEQNATVDAMRKGFTVGALAIKPAIMVKQWVSTLAYLENLSAKDFTSGFIDFWKNPIKNTKILNEESIFIRERGKNMDRDVKAAISTDTFSSFKKKPTFANVLLMNVKLGDKGAILVGSWALRKKLLADGMSQDDVIKKYEKFGNTTQQSSDLSQLSLFQRGGSFAKLFTMFMSSQRQYLNKEVNAVKSLFREEGASMKNIKRVARIMFIYHVLLPVAFQFIANLGRWDEEARKDYLRAGLLGSINGLFIFGQVADGIIRAALGMKVWDISLPIQDQLRKVQNFVIKATTQVDWTDITAEDMEDALGALVEASSVLGLPSKQVAGMVDGVTDMLEGDMKEGVAQVLGWSEYAITGKTKQSPKKGESTRKAPGTRKAPSFTSPGTRQAP